MEEAIEGVNKWLDPTLTLAAEQRAVSTLGGGEGMEKSQEKWMPGFHKIGICNLPNKMA